MFPVFSFFLPSHIDNPIGDAGVALLYEVVKSRINAHLSILTFINLASTSISKEGAKRIYDMIHFSNGALNVSFESLPYFPFDSSDNAIDGEGIGFIFASRYWESFTINSSCSLSLSPRQHAGRYLPALSLEDPAALLHAERAAHRE